MNLWKFRAPNPKYDKARPMSTRPQWLIEVPHPPIHDPEQARVRADELRKRDGLAWEPTPV